MIYTLTRWFQSRNRDACHFRQRDADGQVCPNVSFNLAIEMLVISGPALRILVVTCGCFNLAIEMLVISGYKDASFFIDGQDLVSISQSRCLSFQGGRSGHMPHA